MNNKINGRTPEEIKKGLWCCGSDDEGAHCCSCPYNRGADDSRCISELCVDAHALVNQLKPDRRRKHAD